MNNKNDETIVSSENKTVEVSTKPVGKTKKEPKQKKKLSEKEKTKRLIIALAIVIIILLLFLGFGSVILKQKSDCCNNSLENKKLNIDENQGAFQTDEEKNRYVRQITLPGWGSFNIPANELTISQGFEFHNPAKNSWFEDTVFIGDKELETFIVEENEIELEHLLRLSGNKNIIKSIVSYEKEYFDIYENAENKYVMKGLNGFEGEKEIVVETADGNEVTLTVKSKHDFYYMTFALYLGDPSDDKEDELLYQSNLVEPNKYIQRMDLSHALSSGSYDAFVVCQPYKSDAATPTNNGIVKLVLKAY